jgi:hypothetical protein
VVTSAAGGIGPGVRLRHVRACATQIREIRIEDVDKTVHEANILKNPRFTGLTAGFTDEICPYR